MENAVFNKAQQHILQIMSYVKTPEALRDLERELSRYFAQRVDDEMDQLWNEGKITTETIEDWGREHMRTAYK